MNITNQSDLFYCNGEPIKTISLHIDGILLVPIIVMNLVTIICCIRYHQLRTCTNALIANLATSDFLFGLLTLGPGIWMKINTYPHMFNCVFLMSTGLGSFLFSLSNLMLLSFERYVAVCRPFHYNSWVTYRTTALSIAVCWFSNLIYILILFSFNKWTNGIHCVTTELFPNWLQFTSFGLSVCIFGLTAWCYFHVIMVVKKKFRAVHSNDSCPNIRQVEIKKTIIMIIMFGLFLVLLLPSHLVKLAEINEHSKRDVTTAKCLIYTLVKVNYFSNALVYNTCNRLFRNATLHLLRCSKEPLRVRE